MQERFHVRLEKEYLVFSAAHFITFNQNICERLHGHNYGVRVVVEGPLDENRYVVDFIDVQFGSWHYPTFNVADMAIVAGASLMIIDMFLSNRKQAEARPVGSLTD